MKACPCHPRMALLLLVTALGCAPRPQATKPTATEGPLTVTLHTNKVFIGESFRLEAAIRVPSGARVDVVAPGVPPAVVLRTSRAVMESDGVRRHMWDLVGLRPGNHLVWTGAIQQVDAAGSATALPVPPLRIEVASSRHPDDMSIKDIAGLQHWPNRVWVRVLFMLLLIAALAAALAWGVRMLRRRRRSANDDTRPPVPPHEAAMAALRALREGGIPDTPATIEAYFVKVSGIVRRYLEDAFSLRAPEQTTEEFIRTASTSQKLSLAHQQLVVGFLEQCDLVKFARHIPQAADIMAALDAAMRLVDETKPPPIQPPTNAPAHTP